MPASKFTPRNRTALIAAVRKGNFILPSCRALGITEKTYYRWLERGRNAIAVEEEGGRALTPEERLYVRFLADIEQADAASEQELLEKVLAAAEDPKRNGDWRGYMEVLRIRHVRRWQRDAKVSLELAGDGDPDSAKPIEIKLSFEMAPAPEEAEAA